MIRRLAIAATLAVLAACASSAPPPQTPADAAFADEPPRPLRILTLNVWSGLTYEGTFAIGRHRDDPEARYRLLVEGVRELAPDVVAIQEANPLPGYADRLARDLGYTAAAHVSLGGIRIGPIGIPVNLREGEAVLVRPPATLIDLGAVRLDGSGIVGNVVCLQTGEVTQALRVRVLAHGRPLEFVAVHLHSGPFAGEAMDEARRSRASGTETDFEEAASRAAEDAARRGREIARLGEILRADVRAGEAAVLLGDFNTTAESGELAPLLVADGWTDSFALLHPDDAGPTWNPAANPNYRPPPDPRSPYERLCALQERRPARLDFVLLSPGFDRGRVLESRVVLLPQDGACPSDHYGVLTTIAW